MKVKLLTTAQARNLNKRFDGWLEIPLIPVRGGKWMIELDTGLFLKEWMIDRVDGNPNKKVKALVIWDFLKSLLTYESDDYPNVFYDVDTDKPTPAQQIDIDEYTARVKKFKDDLLLSNPDYYNKESELQEFYIN